jgi:uncharacterized protein YhfF
MEEINMNAHEMWNLFCNRNNIKNENYVAWAFGCAADKLASLVLNEIKVATASAYDLFELDDSEPMPKVGDYSIILNSKAEAVCVIRTTKLYVKKFLEVSEEHAVKEGEGDKSLDYWRKVHKEFFTDEFKKFGLEFSYDMKVLCEEFEVVFRP